MDLNRSRGFLKSFIPGVLSLGLILHSAHSSRECLEARVTDAINESENGEKVIWVAPESKGIGFKEENIHNSEKVRFYEFVNEQPTQQSSDNLNSEKIISDFGKKILKFGFLATEFFEVDLEVDFFEVDVFLRVAITFCLLSPFVNILSHLLGHYKIQTI